MNGARLVFMATLGSLPLQAKVCGLTIGVINEFGISAPYRVQTFRTSDGVDLQKQFEGLSAKNLPCGKYRYVLTRTDSNVPAANLSGEVYLEDLQQWLTVNPSRNLVVGSGGVISVDSALPPDYRMEGHVVPLSSGSPINGSAIFVRLIELYGSRLFEVEVGADGRFSFSRPLSGRYVLLVLQGANVLASELVSIAPTRSPAALEIRLGPGLPFTSVK